MSFEVTNCDLKFRHAEIFKVANCDLRRTGRSPGPGPQVRRLTPSHLLSQLDFIQDIHRHFS